MDVRRHFLAALGYGTPEKPMPDPEPTLVELLNEACGDAVDGDEAIESLKSEMAKAETDSGDYS